MSLTAQRRPMWPTNWSTGTQCRSGASSYSSSSASAFSLLLSYFERKTVRVTKFSIGINYILLEKPKILPVQSKPHFIRHKIIYKNKRTATTSSVRRNMFRTNSDGLSPRRISLARPSKLITFTFTTMLLYDTFWQIYITGLTKNHLFESGSGWGESGPIASAPSEGEGDLLCNHPEFKDAFGRGVLNVELRLKQKELDKARKEWRLEKKRLAAEDMLGPSGLQIRITDIIAEVAENIICSFPPANLNKFTNWLAPQTPKMHLRKRKYSKC